MKHCDKSEVLEKSFFFIRHGETAWNAEYLCQGKQDIDLSNKGKQGVRYLSECLKNEIFDTIIVSSMKRALQTAEIVMEYHPNAELVVLDDLAERGYGRLEGLPSSLMYEFEKLESNSLIDKYNGYKKLEVESWNEFTARLSSAIDTIEEHSSKGKVLVIAHGRVFNGMCSVIGREQILQLKHSDIVSFKKIASEQLWSYEIKGGNNP